MKCRHCGTEIDIKTQRANGTVECPGCGAIYRRKTTGTQPESAGVKAAGAAGDGVCPFCGAPVKREMKFCPSCGRKSVAAPIKDKPAVSGNAGAGVDRRQAPAAGNDHAKQSEKKRDRLSLVVTLLLIAALLIAIFCFFIPRISALLPHSFSIEGKWKNLSQNTYGQVQSGAIVSFNGKNCNFISPSDIYAFYKEGNNYVLDCTTMLFSETESFPVVVLDRNHIKVYTGDWLELERVG